MFNLEKSPVRILIQNKSGVNNKITDCSFKWNVSLFKLYLSILTLRDLESNLFIIFLNSLANSPRELLHFMTIDYIIQPASNKSSLYLNLSWIDTLNLKALVQPSTKSLQANRSSLRGSSKRSEAVKVTVDDEAGAWCRGWGESVRC